MSDSDLKQDKNDLYEWMNDGWSAFSSAALYDMERYLGCADADDAERADRQGRSYLPLNKTKRQINFLHGHEIKNRHILKIGPIGREDDKACQQHTGLIMHEMTAFGGYDYLSEAFKYGNLVSGSNLLEIWKDRAGDIQFGRLGFNEFLLAPDFKKGDLSDCDDILIGKWLTPDKIKLLLPQSADKISAEKIVKTSSRWQYLNPPVLSNDDRRLYEEWWHKETKFTEMVISRNTGQEIEFDKFARQFANGDSRLANRLIKEIKLPGGMPAAERYSKPYNKVSLRVFADDEPVFNGPNPLGTDDYNFVWLHGEFTPEIDRSELKLQSFARLLKESSLLNDRRMNQAMDVLETQIMSGRIMRDKYLKNPKDAYKSGQAVFLHVSDNAPDSLPLEQIFKQIQSTEISASLFKIMEIMEKNEDTIGGLNSDALGANDDANMPGILSMFRTGQALTGQQGIFSSYRRAKKQLGHKLVKINQANYPPQKVQRLIGEMPVKGFYEPDFVKYDCTPTEGILTETQESLFYLELKELRDRYPDAAQMIPISALIEASPMQFKDRLTKMIKQAEQKAAQMQEMAMQDKRKKDKLLEAHTATKVAQAQESITQAQENRAGAALDRAKTISETNKLDVQPQLELLDRILRLEEIVLKSRQISKNERKRRKK